jgi:ABC-type transport system involved in multi-copper enzyme maturation permease subunit
MSTATPTHRVETIDVDRPGIPLSRLIKVEIRKAFDTLSGRWFSASILIICAIALTLFALFADDGFYDFQDLAGIAGGILGFFLPIILIMLVTAEWGQRTGLVTFTLEPRRSRVVVAKLVAGVLISLGVLVVAFGIAALATGFAGLVRDGDPSWSLDTAFILNYVLANIIGVLVGFVIAILLLNTAASIVVYFIYSLVLPIVLGILAATISWFENVPPWIDFNSAQAPMFTGDFKLNGEEWAQLAVTGTIWLIIPLTLGILRLLRSEVK